MFVHVFDRVAPLLAVVVSGAASVCTPVCLWAVQSVFVRSEGVVGHAKYDPAGCSRVVAVLVFV